MAKKKKPPQKECPNCNTKVHTATRVCKCGHQFSAKRKAAPKKSKAAAQKKKSKASPAVGLEGQLRNERKTLEKRITAIEKLLDTYE